MTVEFVAALFASPCVEVTLVGGCGGCCHYNAAGLLAGDVTDNVDVVDTAVHVTEVLVECGSGNQCECAGGGIYQVDVQRIGFIFSIVPGAGLVTEEVHVVVVVGSDVVGAKQTGEGLAVDSEGYVTQVCAGIDVENDKLTLVNQTCFAFIVHTEAFGGCYDGLACRAGCGGNIVHRGNLFFGVAFPFAFGITVHPQVGESVAFLVGIGHTLGLCECRCAHHKRSREK